MGTRGFVGFVVDGEIKIAYNHNDSYPSGVGSDVLSWLHEVTEDVDAVREKARALRVVGQDDEPTDEDIARLTKFTNASVGARNDRPEWYQLLRETQGDLGAMLEAGVIEDASKFPADSLFAEWGYIVDFDENRFEVYRGFQTSPHTKGRFADMEPYPYNVGSDYYPVALVASWALDGLPAAKEFCATADPEDAA
jgi:hypothetical protein